MYSLEEKKDGLVREPGIPYSLHHMTSMILGTTAAAVIIKYPCCLQAHTYETVYLASANLAPGFP